MTPKLLIIPDAHAEPNYDNDRFTWLGNLIFEEKPDVVVCLGDWFDMASPHIVTGKQIGRAHV